MFSVKTTEKKLFPFEFGLGGAGLAQIKTLRMTRQRKVILEVLKKSHAHPTAAEIYDIVREKIPHISLGTVYRNLETLAASGAIQKLEGVGTQKRFDGKLETHDHIQCISCGCIEDIFLESQKIKKIFKSALETNSDYEVLGHHIAFTGICPKCK